MRKKRAIENQSLTKKNVTLLQDGYTDVTKCEKSVTLEIEIEKELELDKKHCVNFDDLPVDTTPKKNTAKIGYSETFEKFWDAYGKHGNKKSAYDKFKQLTESQLQELRVRVLPYVKSTNLDGTYPTRKHAQVYLHPDKEYWNDNIIQCLRDL